MSRRDSVPSRQPHRWGVEIEAGNHIDPVSPLQKTEEELDGTEVEPSIELDSSPADTEMSRKYIEMREEVSRTGSQ